MRDGYKTLGIIGGMGSKATSVFFDRIVDHTVAECDQDHINAVILNYSDFPDRTEAIKSGQTEDIIKALVKACKTLEGLDAANIAIPCNTSHYFMDEMRKATAAYVISMVDESVDKALSMGAKRIGIMATDGTIQADVYGKACKDRGLTAIYPDDELQKDVMSIIYDDIKRGLPGDSKKFNRVIEGFEAEKCDAVILACTELSVYRDNNPVPDFCIDAMDVLVKSSIEKSGATYGK